MREKRMSVKEELIKEEEECNNAVKRKRKPLKR